MNAATMREAVARIRKDCPIPEASRDFDFIDFPTAWAIQHVGVEHIKPCSALQTGGALLCDCQAIYPAWRQWRALLAVAAWIDGHAADLERAGGHTPSCDSPGDVEYALEVAEAYLGSDQ